MNIENLISKTTENIIKEENTLKEKMKFIAMNSLRLFQTERRILKIFGKTEKHI